MKHFSTRKQLLLSVLSLLACVSMLVGSTFAWFTDSVTSGMNTIAAGNLDVELLANGVEVEPTTKLFDDVALWEPGVVVYENLQVANVGTLALKYQLTLNFGNENDLNGHKLSEVLKIAVIDKIAAGATRDEVLAAAKAANPSTLSNLYQIGELEAGAVSAEKTFVIFWEPNSNDVDNLYNANNGQKTSDGQPLHIEFGVNLVATQMMSEEDSFGKDYDKFASILPKAKVNNVSKQYPSIDATWGINGADAEVELDVAMQFQPNESYEDAQSSAYRYWHVDFVVKADKPVPANSVALAGYYQAWCGPLYADGSGWNLNDGKWVALVNDGMDIAAGEEIRLVEGMGGGNISVNYEEICNYGNDGIGFLCGAADLTGENAGTTLTVELRMYETTKAPGAGSGSANVETDNYEVIGSITHTFKNEVSSAADLKAQLEKGNDVVLAADIAMDTSINIANGKEATLDLNGHTITGSDTITGSFGLINNKGTLTLKDSVGTGKITLKASENRGWNAYSSVISNSVGGKFILESGTIEHLGGTAMAYGIDNLTNGKNTYAETVINGGVVISPYRAIRMFLNGIEAQNILTVNGGKIIGANKSIWMQDPSANANTGTLTVTEDAILDGDVYLFVTSGSTEWPVSVSINENALAGDSEVLDGNVPAGYDVVLEGGCYIVKVI